jgi:hypothetical protein
MNIFWAILLLLNAFYLAAGTVEMWVGDCTFFSCAYVSMHQVHFIADFAYYLSFKNEMNILLWKKSEKTGWAK